MFSRKMSKYIDNYNCSGISDTPAAILFSVTVASLLFAFVESLSMYFIDNTAKYLVLVISSITISVFAIYSVHFGKKNISRPYIRKDGYMFLGLFDLSKVETINQSDVISREEEVIEIKNTLENIIFQQRSLKQALVLIGKSGCGKSTIISFFKRKYAEEYEIYDFSGNYTKFEEAMVNIFGNDIDNMMDTLIEKDKKKVILVLDQFERYFYLEDEEQKKQVRQILNIFVRKNAAVIVSMREEYFSNFLAEFDVNDIRDKADRKLNHTGVLKNLIGIVKDSGGKSISNVINNGLEVMTFGNQMYKNNHFVHLENPGFDDRTILEKVGVTVFYCENQNNAIVKKNNDYDVSEKMLIKCQTVLGDVLDKNEIDKFYSTYKNSPLIEQQIIFHMIEFEKKENNLSKSEIKDLVNTDSNKLLDMYFERQIEQCCDDYNAMRILYLLSVLNQKHISMKMVDLKEGLFLDQFGSKIGGRNKEHSENEKLNRVKDKLLELQLIKQRVSDSDIEYEIAHDYIATGFLNYCNTKLNRNIKNALDLYITNYIEEKNPDREKERKEFNEKKKKDTYFSIIANIAIIMVFVIDFIERFIYNPFENIWQYLDCINGYMPCFSLVINVVSICYLKKMYDKFVKFYRGRGATVSKILYIPVMIFAVGGALFYPHVVAFDGISLGLYGVNMAIAFKGDTYYETAKKEFVAYGLKCALMGFVYAIFHISFAIIFKNNFQSVVIILDYTVLWLLVIYACIAHTSKDFLYMHRMDLSCER